MNNANPDEREERALEALIVAAFHLSPEDPTSFDDPHVLSEEDRQALDALGPDLIDRVLKGQPAPRPARKGTVSPAPQLRPEAAALHRGDEQLTPGAEEEIERQRRKLLSGDEHDPDGGPSQ